jgi:serine/threonine protein kinase
LFIAGIPKIHWYGQEATKKAMVLELLGKSLERNHIECDHKFSLKTVCMLSEQLLIRIEMMHKNLHLHRDIKPDNFLMGGTEETKRALYIIDFGLAKRYIDKKTE